VTEQLRQHYLQAFGIETYVPRWALPGAAALVMFASEAMVEGEAAVADCAEAVDADVVEASAALADNSRGVGGEARVSLAGDLPGRSKQARESQRSVVEAPLRTAPVHRFVLSAWRILDDVVVLDSRRLKLALPVERLLLNISQALGFGGGTALPPAELLRWPLLDTAASPRPDLVKSVAEARAMVHAYLAAQNEKQRVKTVLLMGADAARHALSARDFEPGSECEEWLGQSFTLPLDGDSSLRAIVLPSLAAMLQHPPLKALTWKAIKHLRVDR
jgi:hypothetical protein